LAGKTNLWTGMAPLSCSPTTSHVPYVLTAAGIRPAHPTQAWSRPSPHCGSSLFYLLSGL